MSADSNLESNLRRAVETVLVQKYGALIPVRGQGVRRGSRFILKDKGNEIVCLVKTSSTHGRIHFPRGEDGSWNPLSEADRVVVARVNPSGPGILIRMFDRETVVEAFVANYEATSRQGMGHMPAWISPDHEADRGVRAAGDGFAPRALWSVVVPAAGPESPQLAESPIPPAPRPFGTLNTVAEVLAAAKERIAALTGVPPSAVSLDLSVSWS